MVGNAGVMAKYFGDPSTSVAPAMISSASSGGAPSTSASAAVAPGSGTPVTRKTNMENIQLAECIGNVRALLIGIFCDDIFKDIATDEG